VAAKPDSQDICFVPTGGYASIVEKLRPEAFAPGDIVDLDGRTLGRHEGVANFTVGQRRGLGVAADRPLYVVRIEPDAARVVVGPYRALLRDRLTIREVNWLGDDGSLPADGVRAQVKLRSTQPPVAARVLPRPAPPHSAPHSVTAEIILDEPQAGIAPGQACVFYDSDRVLGGGWICREAAAA